MTDKSGVIMLPRAHVSDKQHIVPISYPTQDSSYCALVHSIIGTWCVVVVDTASVIQPGDEPTGLLILVKTFM